MADTTTAVPTDGDVDIDLMRVYEVGYHIVPTVNEDKIDGVVGEIRSAIEKVGGSFITEGAPSLLKLAYSITTREAGRYVDHDRGYFGWIKFETAASSVSMLDEDLKNNDNILRFIIFRTAREETRARMKIPTLREVRRTDVIKSTPRRPEEKAEAVSEEDLDKAIQDLTVE